MDRPVPEPHEIAGVDTLLLQEFNRGHGFALMKRK